MPAELCFNDSRTSRLILRFVPWSSPHTITVYDA